MGRRSRFQRSAYSTLEPLEGRVLLSALTVAEVRKAYGFDQVGLTGAGQTIAIVGAYDAPTIAADLDVFSSAMGVPGGPASTYLTKVMMGGYVPPESGWAQELTMDAQWAHAIAPGAKILLVEAASPRMSDMLAAVNWARSQPGVSVVSMSWGGTEFGGQSTLDRYFTTPRGHTGVTFVAAAGDTGGVSSYPAMSTNVLSVGGTRLTVDSAGNTLAETAWSGSGGGISGANGAPAWQAFTGLGARIGPDVSYVADPATGVLVYDSYPHEGYKGWMAVGGTSAGAPQWAGLIALANEGRARAGLPPLDGATQTLPALYNAPSWMFRDIVQGATNSWIRAAPGYDLATGRGSPNALGLIQYLSGYNRVTPAVVRGSGLATASAPVQRASAPARVNLAELTSDPVLTRAPEWFSHGLHRLSADSAERQVRSQTAVAPTARPSDSPQSHAASHTAQRPSAPADTHESQPETVLTRDWTRRTWGSLFTRPWA